MRSRRSVALAPPRMLGLAALAIVAVSAAFKMYCAAYGYSGHALMVVTPARLDGPFMGVLCAWIWRVTDVPRLVERHGRALRAGAIGLIGAHYAAVNYSLISYHLPSLTVNAIVFGLATLAFAGSDPRAPNRMTRALRWSGVRCYAIYVFHVAVLGAVSNALFHWPPNVFPPGIGWPAVGLALVLTYAAAAVSWRWFERPLMLAASRRAAPATITDTAHSSSTIASGPATESVEGCTS